MESNLLYTNNNIFTKTPHIYHNLNTTITKNLNVIQNTTLNKLFINNGIHTDLLIKGNTIISKNLNIYGNLTVHGSKVNIISEKTQISDPLIVFGLNQSKSSIDNSYGGFVVGHTNHYSGLIRKPQSSHFYLAKNIPEISNSIDEPNLSNYSPIPSKLADLYTYNLNSTYINSNDLYINGNSTITQNLNILRNLNISDSASIAKDLTISGNLVVSGNHTVLITNHLDVTDPIITISNTSKDHDRGLLIKKQDNNYTGLIRNKTDSNYYLLDNVTDPYSNNIPTINKSTLILENINTSNTSFITGTSFISNNDSTNKNDIIATFPNNTSTEHIHFYKSTQFNNKINIKSNVNLTGNFSVSDEFILLNTNSLVTHGKADFYGTTNLYGPTNISNLVDFKHSSLAFDHLKVRSYIHSDNTIDTNKLFISNILQIPTKPFNNENKPGTIFFNTSSNLYEAHNNEEWLPMGGINPYTDTTINHNLFIRKNLNVYQNINCNNVITSNTNIINNFLKIPVGTTNSYNEAGSIFFNTTSNLYESHNGSEWLPMGGINPYTDTTISHNLTIHKNLNVKQNINCNDTITSKKNIITDVLRIPSKTSFNTVDALFIDNSRLKLGSNIIAYDTNITQLSVSTDLFQFYNVQQNNEIFGNRVTGLNDPTMNTFSKYYTIKEYTFYQQTFISNIEFYVTNTVDNNTSNSPNPLSITITIYNNNVESLSQTFNNTDTISIGQIITKSLSNSITFQADSKVKIKLKLNNNYNGHEIFIRLYGYTQISPQIHNLKLTSTSNWNDTPPALEVNGGATFSKSIQATNVSTFTGCHISNLITPTNYNLSYSYIENDQYIFKPGLIVSVSNSTHIDISNSKFNISLSNKQNDSTVFGVINKHINNNNYLINSLGEGAIWVSNICGNINNGDYITSSNILGYGCKQGSPALHNYTVAKCCSVINWSTINDYVPYYDKSYKIAFVSCTYHCG